MQIEIPIKYNTGDLVYQLAIRAGLIRAMHFLLLI
jgi:hypothetical protein